MYLETSSPRLENDTARLFSPVFPPSKNNDSCFVFWYHMYGATTGSLHVYLHEHDTILIFSESGDHGNRWIKGIIPLPFIPTSFQIIIEGVRGTGYVGDTAIDDVKLTDGEECTNSGHGGPESCQGRCYDSKVLSPSACECHQDCFSSATCCPDFVELCGIVATQTAGVMPFSSKVSSDHMTVTTITSFPSFILNTTASTKSSTFTEKLQYYMPTVAAVKNFTKNPFTVEQTKSQNLLSSLGVHNNIFETQTTLPLQQYTLNYENDSVTLNENVTYFSVFTPINHTLLPVLKNVTENHSDDINTSFSSFSESVPFTTNKTTAEYKITQSIIHILSKPVSSTQSPNERITESIAKTRQYMHESSNFKQSVTKSFNPSTLLSISIFPITINTTMPVFPTVKSSVLTETNANLSTIHKFNVLKITTSKPVLNHTRILLYNNPFNQEYVNRLNKLRNMTRFLPVKSNAPSTTFVTVTQQNSASDGDLKNKTVSSKSETTNLTFRYKQLFPPSLPKAKNDVLYPTWVKPEHGEQKPLQLPTSEPQLTSTLHTLSLSNSKRNPYVSLPIIPTTMSYKKTVTHKFPVYATPSKWISKYKPKGKVEKFSAQSSYNMMAGIGTAFGVVTFLMIGTAAAIIIIRKRKINRRNNLDNDESDHLTSDEVLDLTWCGPVQPIQQDCIVRDN